MSYGSPICLYVYHRPDQMQGHEYTDDVAICYARNKEEAVSLFSRLYGADEKYVEEVSFNSYGVAILTDY